jgi:glycosyltransferase involved in cell wall biosynthesis
MCTYNGSQYLTAQLESIAQQSRVPDELVVCDDASKDDTLRIVEQFAQRVSFPVRLEVNNCTLGSTKNFEKAIGLCNGNLIALADQDDVWLQHKLETLEREFVRRPNVGLVFSDADVVDETLESLDVSMWTAIGFDENLRRKIRSNRALDVLLPGWTVTGATMAFRSKFCTVILPIPDDLPLIHDGWIAALIVSLADVSFIEEPLIKYRQHRQQQIGAPQSQIPERIPRIERARAAMTRTNPYRSLILISERVRSRLLEHSEDFDSTIALRILDERIGHLRTRENLPNSKAKRLPQVLRELFSKRYHLYSKGLQSAMKDLLT